MTNIGANLNVFPFSKAQTQPSGASSLLGNNTGAASLGIGGQGGAGASFFALLEQMPQAMQKVAHAIAAKTESDLNHDDKLALKIFLARMQKDLGVKPEQILQAFSKLTVHDLALPPEATADKFVSELKLDHKGEKKARDLYSKLLGILSTTDIMKKRVATLSNTMDKNFDYLEGKKTLTAGGVQNNATPLAQPQPKSHDHTLLETLGATSVVAAALAKSAAVNASTTGTTAAKSAVGPAKSAVGHMATQSSTGPVATHSPKATLDVVKSATTQATVKPPMGQAAMKPATSQVVTKPAAAHLAANAKPNMTMPQADIHPQAANTATAAQPQTAVAANPVQAALAPPAPAPTIQTTVIATGAVAATSAAAHSKASGLAAYQQNDGSADGDSDHDKQNETQAPIMVDSAVTQKPDALNNVQAQSAQGDAAKIVQSNVNELISHAQFLAHKGGGEMKVSLKPDGLGEVKLNVKMQNGQMSVQLLASNEDAKNVIQKGLGELKTSLAAHHIHVDTIRVDSPKDLIGQFLQHRHQQMEQNFQRRFLSNFQQRNDSNRQSMFDFGSPEIPFNQVTDRASNARYASAAAKRSNRRLDLVA